MPKSQRKRGYSKKYKYGKMSYVDAAKTAANVIGTAYKAYKAYRSSRSKRATKSKPIKSRAPRLTWKYVSNGTGMTTSRWTHKYKQMPGYTEARKLAVVDRLLRNKADCFLSETGRQAAYMLDSLLDSTEILDIYNRAIRTTLPYFNAADASTTARNKILWGCSFETEYLFTNHSPGCCVLDIYDIICKKESAALYTPILLWQAGLDQQQGTGAVPTYKYYGSRPQDSSAFNRVYKILRKTEVELHTGRSHKHVKKILYRGKLPYSTAYSLAPTNTNIEGVTHLTMIVFHGMVVGDKGEHAVDEKISLDKCKLTYVATQRFSSMIVESKAQRLTMEDALDQDLQNAFAQDPDGSGVYNSNANITGLPLAFS